MTDHDPPNTELTPHRSGSGVTVHGWGYGNPALGATTGAYAPVTQELLELLLHGLTRWAPMTHSEARRKLSRPAEAYGKDGVLMTPHPDPENPEHASEGGDLPPGSSLDWPPCRCGQPVCPEYEPPTATTTPATTDPPCPPGPPTAQGLSERLAERNKRSGRGGL